MDLDERKDSIRESKSPLKNNEQNVFREYAWQYFLAHAQARLTTFRFYLTFCSIIATGLIAIVSQTKHAEFAAILAFILAILSFVFWKIDLRHKGLIKHAEFALKWLENETGLPDIDGQPHPLKIFCREENITSQLTRFPKEVSYRAFFSYSMCVNIIFALFGFGGYLFGILSLLCWR